MIRQGVLTEEGCLAGIEEGDEDGGEVLQHYRAAKRVHKTRNGVTVDVERARDLEARSFDLRRVRWRKVKE